MTYSRKILFGDASCDSKYSTSSSDLQPEQGLSTQNQAIWLGICWSSLGSGKHIYTYIDI